MLIQICLLPAQVDDVSVNYLDFRGELEVNLYYSDGTQLTVTLTLTDFASKPPPAPAPEGAEAPVAAPSVVNVTLRILVGECIREIPLRAA